jgi:proteic killer suppression protein
MGVAVLLAGRVATLWRWRRGRIVLPVLVAVLFLVGGGFVTIAVRRSGHRRRVKRFDPRIERVALRKLAMLDAAECLDDLRVPPGNRLEALTGDRMGQHSIRINQQWRICFIWTAAGPEDVEIVDYP